MSLITIPCTPERNPYVFKPVYWDSCISDLSNDPESGEVYCISYEVRASKTTAGSQHNLRAHLMKDGHCQSRAFGDASPEITRRYAFQGFNIINHTTLQVNVEGHLKSMMALRGHKGSDNFEVCVCPFGVFTIAHELSEKHYMHQGVGVIGAMIPTVKLSNHQRLKVKLGLQSCINTMIMNATPVMTDDTGYHVDINM